MTHEEWQDARLMTWPIMRHLFRYSVGDDWMVDAVWCDLYPTQEDNRP